MSNPSKKKGTRAETRVVDYLRYHGIQAERKALSGSHDKGDIKVHESEFVPDLVLEVKSGKQTANPSRRQLAEWMDQAIVEGENAGCRGLLVVARYNRRLSDYDVWYMDANKPEVMVHWYLDEWCEHWFLD